MLRSSKTLVLCVTWICVASVLLSSLPKGSAGANKKPIRYHGGPLLTGTVKLSLLWYGSFDEPQKDVLRSFIQSLHYNAAVGVQPQVSAWWRVVESYQSLGKPSRFGPIDVSVIREANDPAYSVGKVLIEQEFIPRLVQKATAGLPPETVAVILTDKQVTVQGICRGQCAAHGVIGKTPYVMATDPTRECPGPCAWPFHPAGYGPKGLVLRPPNGQVGLDAMVINLARGLASVVTNPYNTGFFEGRIKKQVEATTQCPNMIGSGAVPGNPGKHLLSPDGGAFNALGVKGKKFLLPAIWNPSTRSCWTLM